MVKVAWLLLENLGFAGLEWIPGRLLQERLNVNMRFTKYRLPLCWVAMCWMWPNSLCKELALEVLIQCWIIIWIVLLLLQHLNSLINLLLYFAVDVLHPLYLLQDFRIINN